MNKVLWALLLLALAGAVLWFLQGRPETLARQAALVPVPVTVIEVQEREFSDEVSALGTLRAWESVDVSSSVSQIITQLDFEDGQQVRKGQILALLKQDSEQAILRELQASLMDAQREMSRLANLARQNQVAQTDLDKARTLEQVIRHRIEEVQSRIADRTILAPFDGVLGLRQVSVGALVAPGQQLTTLDDLSKMRLQFNVPATLLAFLQVGQVVEARTPAFQQSFAGQVSALDSRVDPIARAITVRAVLDNPGQVLRAGLLMEVRIRGPLRTALLVPEESLESRSVTHYVWRLQGDIARRTEVEIGGRSPGWVEVLQGLTAGDTIVRDGLGRLKGDQAQITRVEH